MEHIQFVLRVAGAILVLIITIRIYMRVAQWIGEEFGVGTFCRTVLQKIKNKKDK